MKEIVLGQGKVFIAKIIGNKRSGIIFIPTPHKHPIGSVDLTLEGKYVPTDDDVIIWIDSEESAEVLRERVNTICDIIKRKGTKK